MKLPKFSDYFRRLALEEKQRTCNHKIKLNMYKLVKEGALIASGTKPCYKCKIKVNYQIFLHEKP